MQAITRQYLLTIYTNGAMRITERALPKRGWHGQFVGKRPKVITPAICPKCGTELGLVAL